MSRGDELEYTSSADCQEAESPAANLAGDTWKAPKKSRTRKSYHRSLHKPRQQLVKPTHEDSEFVDAPIKSVKVGDQEWILYGGANCSFHGHNNRDDGMGTVDSQAELAIRDGVGWFGQTLHNHKESRNGVPPDDSRAKDEQGKPLIVDDPPAYAQLRRDSERISEEGKTFVFYGLEMGTISKTNHLIVIDEPTLLIADLDGNKKEYPVRRFLELPKQLQTADGDPPVFHYNVTDGLAVIEKFRQLNRSKNSILAHPQDVPQEKGLPKGVSPNHYFMNCYPNQYEWAKSCGPYYAGIGAIQGHGLTKGPMEHMSPRSLKLQPVFGYNDTGIKLAMVFERDQHYGDPGGRPAGMALLVRSTGRPVDKPALREALAERHSVVSTLYDDLHAVTTANDKYVMGNVINPAEIDHLQFKVLIGGRLDRKATYNVKLWVDTAIGDLKTATVVEEKSVTGDELLKNNQEVQFDDVNYKPKNSNAFTVEIERAYPGQNGQREVDIIASTTSIWVQPENWEPGPVKGANNSVRNAPKPSKH